MGLTFWLLLGNISPKMDEKEKLNGTGNENKVQVLNMVEFSTYWEVDLFNFWMSLKNKENDAHKDVM